MEKLRAPLGIPCSEFTGKPANVLMLALTTQEESNTKSVTASTKMPRLPFSKICGIALFINLQKYHYLRKRASNKLNFGGYTAIFLFIGLTDTRFRSIH